MEQSKEVKEGGDAAVLGGSVVLGDSTQIMLLKL